MPFKSNPLLVLHKYKHTKGYMELTLAHKSTQDEYLTGKCKDWVNAQGFDIWKVLVSASLRWYLERSSWYLSKNLRLYKMIIFTKRYKRILSLWLVDNCFMQGEHQNEKKCIVP